MSAHGLRPYVMLRSSGNGGSTSGWTLPCRFMENCQCWKGASL